MGYSSEVSVERSVGAASLPEGDGVLVGIGWS
jgi:hypothetical protein